METKKSNEKDLALKKADEGSDDDIDQQLAALEAKKKKVNLMV